MYCVKMHEEKLTLLPLCRILLCVSGGGVGVGGGAMVWCECVCVVGGGGVIFM